MKAPPPSAAETVSAVRAVYAELERRPVERQCTRLTECCRFRLTGKTPFLTRAEALLAASAWRATGRGSLPAPSDDGACPMLGRDTGHCAIYADRPFGCRTHFCAAAGGPYARREVVDLIYKLEDLSRRLGATEAQALPAALPAALALLEQERGRRTRAR